MLVFSKILLVIKHTNAKTAMPLMPYSVPPCNSAKPTRRWVLTMPMSPAGTRHGTTLQTTLNIAKSATMSQRMAVRALSIQLPGTEVGEHGELNQAKAQRQND